MAAFAKNLNFFQLLRRGDSSIGLAAAIILAVATTNKAPGNHRSPGAFIFSQEHGFQSADLRGRARSILTLSYRSSGGIAGPPP
jgi:hypothetical protein